MTTRTPSAVGPGRIFGPGPAGRWDDTKVSCPVVLLVDGEYWMYYYGHDATFPGLGAGTTGVPMGRTGLARSRDGIHWERVDGPGALGSVLDPSPDPGRFDSWQVGATDVVRVNDEFRMYYAGCAETETEFMGMRRKGYPLRIGLAVSTDGVTFEKVPGEAGDGAVLGNGAPGQWDDIQVACPRLVQHADGSWRMYYHSRRPPHPGGFGLAESIDGLHWTKRPEPIFGPSGDPERFDATGLVTRHIIPWERGYLMAYEGLPAGPTPYTFSRIGLAYSDDGISWERLTGPQTFGSIVDVGEPGAWDGLAIGTPWFLRDLEGRLRLYYVGYDAESRNAIGMALQDDPGDVLRWTKFSAE